MIFFFIFFIQRTPAAVKGAVIDQGLDAKLLIQKGSPGMVHIGFQRRIKLYGSCQQPTPALSV